MIANLSGTPKRLAQGAIGSTSTTLYTAQPDGRSCVLDVVILNTTSSTITVSMYVGSVASGNEFFVYNTPIAPGIPVQLSGYQILNINESIYAIGSATGLTISISGLERV